MNRGKRSLEDIYHFALLEQYDVVIVISERYGNPSRIVFYELDTTSSTLKPSLTLYLKGVSLAREKNVPHKKSKVSCVVQVGDKARDLTERLSRTLNLPYCPPDPIYKAWISVESFGEIIAVKCLHRGGISGPFIKVYSYE